MIVITEKALITKCLKNNDEELKTKCNKFYDKKCKQFARFVVKLLGTGEEEVLTAQPRISYYTNPLRKSLRGSRRHRQLLLSDATTDPVTTCITDPVSSDTSSAAAGVITEVEANDPGAATATVRPDVDVADPVSSDTSIAAAGVITEVEANDPGAATASIEDFFLHFVSKEIDPNGLSAILRSDIENRLMTLIIDIKALVEGAANVLSAEEETVFIRRNRCNCSIPAESFFSCYQTGRAKRVRNDLLAKCDRTLRVGNDEIKPTAYADIYNRGPRPQTEQKPICATCGRPGHHRNDCHYFMNDMCNNTHEAWEDSGIGMAWLREGHSHFKPGVKLQNYNMATNTKGKMPPNWVYPTEEDKVGQDLPAKYQKTSHQQQ